MWDQKGEEASKKHLAGTSLVGFDEFGELNAQSGVGGTATQGVLFRTPARSPPYLASSLSLTAFPPGPNSTLSATTLKLPFSPTLTLPSTKTRRPRLR